MRTYPHDPRPRFGRGETLLGLGYPELAVGDFERTLMLIEHGLDYTSELGQKVRFVGLQEWVQKDVCSNLQSQ